MKHIKELTRLCVIIIHKFSHAASSSLMTANKKYLEATTAFENVGEKTVCSSHLVHLLGCT